MNKIHLFLRETYNVFILVKGAVKVNKAHKKTENSWENEKNSQVQHSVSLCL